MRSRRCSAAAPDRKSTRLNSSHVEIYTLSLHGALPICTPGMLITALDYLKINPSPTEDEIRDAISAVLCRCTRSEEHTSELQSRRDLHSFPTRRSSDLHARHADHRARLPEDQSVPDRGRDPRCDLGGALPLH